MSAPGHWAAASPGRLGRVGWRWLPCPLPLFPHLLSNIGPLYGLHLVGAIRTIFGGFRRANIGPPLLEVPAAVVSSVVVEILVVGDPSLRMYSLHVYSGIGQPSARIGCTRSTHWGLRPCIHLYYNSLRVTRYVRGETIDPRNFGSQSCYYPRESVL